MGDSPNLSQVGSRIEGLLDDIAGLTDRPTHEKTEELVRLLMELYGAGLERVLEIAYDQGGEQLLLRMAEDELIESLMVLHGLHPLGLDERVQQALETVRPYLGSHAGGVEYLGVDDDNGVHLRLQGSCDGCASSTVTVKLAIERAVLKAAPEVTGIHVEGLSEPERAGSGLLQIESLDGPPENGTGPAGGEWLSLGALDLPVGEMEETEVSGVSVLLCSAGGDLLAYRNACASCGSRMEGGSLRGERLTCPACGHEYDVRLAGRSADGAPLHLDPFPLVSDGADIRIAIPARAHP
jgi:Fe-S cluster biogenesis protein NfuA/nitrite reductase/ring-hydroxylating ferredoxin subunit